MTSAGPAKLVAAALVAITFLGPSAWSARGQDAGQGLPSPADVNSPVRYGALDYSNPYQQTVHPRWANGEVVWSMPLGPVAIDPAQTKTADEYVLVYALSAGSQPERVQGQYTIYDSRPGEPGYSAIWRTNYVLVPRDYEPQTLRSKEDVLRSGYQVVATDEYTN